MILNFTRATVCFLVAYVLVTIFATASSVIYGMLNVLPPLAPGESILQDAAFVATVPYHVLIMVIVWPAFAWIYFRKPGSSLVKKETLQLAFFWLVAAMIVDLVFFVLVQHPYSLSVYEFYVVYQPWISLIYLAIFISPLIANSRSLFSTAKT
jgi:hypothetical protein